MMPGMITLWSGAIVDIPVGWALCDGSNGTPDLRNRFVPGAGDTYAVGDTGGSATHRHTCASGSYISAGADYDRFLSYENSLPPYYALAYVMKT